MPDDHADVPGGKSVDAGIRRRARTRHAWCRERRNGFRHGLPDRPSRRVPAWLGLPSVPVVTTETRRSMPVASLKIATHSCARATASACLPGAMRWVLRWWIMGLSLTPVCVRRTPPTRPCVWPSVPCWSTGDAAYPHPQHRARKRNRPAITRMHRAGSQCVGRLGVADPRLTKSLTVSVNREWIPDK